MRLPERSRKNVKFSNPTKVFLRQKNNNNPRGNLKLNSQRSPGQAPSLMDDLISLGNALPPVTQSQPTTSGNLLDELDFFSSPQQPASSPKEVVLPAERGNGLQVAGAFVRRDGQIYLDFTFSNQTGGVIPGVAIQFNKNSFGLSPSQPQVQIAAGQSADASILLGTHPDRLNPNPPASNNIQIALKTVIGGADKILYFQMSLPLQVLFVENGQMGREEYLSLWKNTSGEHFQDVTPSSNSPDVLQKKLEANRVFYIARRTVQQQVRNTRSILTRSGISLLFHQSRTEQFLFAHRVGNWPCREQDLCESTKR